MKRMLFNVAIILSWLVIFLLIFHNEAKSMEASINVGGGHVFYGPDSEGTFEDIYIADIDFTLKKDIFKLKHMKVDWNVDIGIIKNEYVHPKVFTTLMCHIPIGKDIYFVLGGGFGYIYNSGEIDGLDHALLAGTVRIGLKVNQFFIGADHYSLVFRHDPGRNPIRFGITFDF